MKVRRSDRLIDMTRYLLERPHTLIPLTFFSKRYESAKSSISEDLAIVRRTFAQRQTGILETVPGAAGGVRYIPIMGEDEAENFIAAMSKRLSETDRLLPGGYVYLSDLLGTPSATANWAINCHPISRGPCRCCHDGCNQRYSNCAKC